MTVTLNPAVDQTITIPGFMAGAVNRVQEIRSSAGGKGVNVASVLADYGYVVSATGCLGSANAGLFEELFARKRIEDHFVRLSGATRTAIKIIDAVRHQTTDINFPGETPVPEQLTVLKEVLNLVPCDWCVIAGSIPARVDPAIYRELIMILKEHGRKVAVDTSGDALRAAVTSAPNIIKPNIFELEMLLDTNLPDRSSVINAAKCLNAKGVELVIVSMGEQGACFVRDEEILVALPPETAVVSTVGAGDAMIAGAVAGQLRGLDLAGTARLATAFAVDALTRIEAGLTSVSTIDELATQVTVLAQ